MLNISALSTSPTPAKEIYRPSQPQTLPDMTQVSNVSAELLSSPPPSSPMYTLASLIEEIRNEMEIVRKDVTMAASSPCRTSSVETAQSYFVAEHNDCKTDQRAFSFELDTNELPQLFQSPSGNFSATNLWENGEAMLDWHKHIMHPSSSQASLTTYDEPSEPTQLGLQTNDTSCFLGEQKYVTPPRKKKPITVQTLLAWQNNMSLPPAQRLSQESFAISHETTLDKLSRYINAEGLFIQKN